MSKTKKTVDVKKTKFKNRAECFKKVGKVYNALERIEGELQDELETLSEELMYGSKGGGEVTYGQVQPRSLIEKNEIYAEKIDEKAELQLKVDNISLILNRMNQIMMRLPKEDWYPCYIIYIKNQKNKFEGGSRFNSEILLDVEDVMKSMDVAFLETKINDKSIRKEMLKVGLVKKKKKQ